MHLESVNIGSRSIEPYREVVGEQRFAALSELATRLSTALQGRVVWNVNSTSRGGGVAEMLRPLLAYVRGAGVDTRWRVIQGDNEFFAFTKRLHNALHGELGDGSPVDDSRRLAYEETLARNAHELCAVVQPEDFVVLHDPQTVGLAPHVACTGAAVIWRCHVGTEQTNEQTRAAWDFIEPYLGHVNRLVFTRDAFVPERFRDRPLSILPPGIDALAAKNQEMSADTSRAILVHAGVLEGPPGEGLRVFTREDGSPGRVDRIADVLRAGRAPTWETPLVLQVSRWDNLKDPIGVMHGFARMVDGRVPADAQLVLAGPSVRAVADDPEGQAVFDEVEAAWRALPQGVRRLVHLVSLPMEDAEENAAMVNALQRHASVVVQKSLQEGFGLTVTEAMWKSKPVVASRVGGIQDQVRHEVEGLLLDDPRDLDTFAAYLERLLLDPELRLRMGRAGHQRVLNEYLLVRQIDHWAELIRAVAAQPR